MLQVLFTSVLIVLSLPDSTISLETFGDSSQLEWRIVNDGVMGGLSSSSMTINEDGYGVFEGTVSLENYGGFASTRALIPESDYSDVKKIRIRVKGDGQRYSFRIRTNRNFDGPAYVISFDTRKDEWTTHELELEDFVPQFRGRVLRDRPPLKGSDMQQLGILIADKQEGDFRLMIDSIEALK